MDREQKKVTAELKKSKCKQLKRKTKDVEPNIGNDEIDNKENTDDKIKMVETKLEKKISSKGVNTDGISILNTFKIGDYVIVLYDNKQDPGVITDIENEEYEVSVMHQTSNKMWKWPKHTDQIWYKRNQIIKHILKPQPLDIYQDMYNIEM